MPRRLLALCPDWLLSETSAGGTLPLAPDRNNPDRGNTMTTAQVLQWLQTLTEADIVEGDEDCFVIRQAEDSAASLQLGRFDSDDFDFGE